MGAFQRNDSIKDDMERVYALFPRLYERRQQAGGTLSGGEQQMLAIGRAMMAKPQVLLLDEPSMGLSPILVETIFSTILDINKQGTTILLVEQNAAMALSIAARGYVLESRFARRLGYSREPAQERPRSQGLSRRGVGHIRRSAGCARDVVLLRRRLRSALTAVARSTAATSATVEMSAPLRRPAEARPIVTYGMRFRESQARSRFLSVFDSGSRPAIWASSRRPMRSIGQSPSTAQLTACPRAPAHEPGSINP